MKLELSETVRASTRSALLLYCTRQCAPFSSTDQKTYGEDNIALSGEQCALYGRSAITAHYYMAYITFLSTSQRLLC